MAITLPVIPTPHPEDKPTFILYTFSSSPLASFSSCWEKQKRTTPSAAAAIVAAWATATRLVGVFTLVVVIGCHQRVLTQAVCVLLPSDWNLKWVCLWNRRQGRAGELMSWWAVYLHSLMLTAGKLSHEVDNKIATTAKCGKLENCTPTGHCRWAKKSRVCKILRPQLIGGWTPAS